MFIILTWFLCPFVHEHTLCQWLQLSPHCLWTQVPALCLLIHTQSTDLTIPNNAAHQNHWILGWLKTLFFFFKLLGPFEISQYTSLILCVSVVLPSPCVCLSPVCVFLYRSWCGDPISSSRYESCASADNHLINPTWSVNYLNSGSALQSLPDCSVCQQPLLWILSNFSCCARHCFSPEIQAHHCMTSWFVCRSQTLIALLCLLDNHFSACFTTLA